MVLVGGATRAVYQGECTWVGILVGILEGYTGVLPTDRARKALPAKRAPEGLQGLEWVGRAWTRVPGCSAAGRVSPTLRARSVLPWRPSLGIPLGMPPLGQ